MNNNIIIDRLPWLSCLALLVAFLWISGCNPIRDNWETRVHDDKDVLERKALEKGYKAFYRGDFHQAAKTFDALKNQNNKRLSQKALFASACTKFVLADTAKARKKAITQLRQWIDSGAMKLDRDDLKLLQVLLREMITRIQDEKPAKKVLDTSHTNQLQEQLSMKEEEIVKLNQKVKSMQKEIVILKNKIKTIEEIDQKIQEKKNPYHHMELF